MSSVSSVCRRSIEDAAICDSRKGSAALLRAVSMRQPAQRFMQRLRITDRQRRNGVPMIYPMTVRAEADGGISILHRKFVSIVCRPQLNFLPLFAMLICNTLQEYCFVK